MREKTLRAESVITRGSAQITFSPKGLFSDINYLPGIGYILFTWNGCYAPESLVGCKVPVEKQRIVCVARDGVTVLPGGTVVGSPESHTVNNVPVVVEYAEEFFVPVRKLLLDFCGKAVTVRVKELLELLQLELGLGH